MVNHTKIVVGRVGDTLTSEAESVAAENFTSVYDAPVKLAHTNLVDGTVVVDNPDNGNFLEDTDYTIDYLAGTITVISDDPGGGNMLDDTEYSIVYDWNIPHLAFKINEVTTTAGVTILYVCTTRAGRNGVATIVYTTA